MIGVAHCGGHVFLLPRRNVTAAELCECHPKFLILTKHYPHFTNSIHRFQVNTDRNQIFSITIAFDRPARELLSVKTRDLEVGCGEPCTTWIGQFLSGFS